MARRPTLVCAGMCSEGTDCDCSLWVLAFGAGSARSGQGGGGSRHAQSAHICSNTRDPQSHTGNMCTCAWVCVCVCVHACATEAALCERNLWKYLTFSLHITRSHNKSQRKVCRVPAVMLLRMGTDSESTHQWATMTFFFLVKSAAELKMIQRGFIFLIHDDVTKRRGLIQSYNYHLI